MNYKTIDKRIEAEKQYQLKLLELMSSGVKGLEKVYRASHARVIWLSKKC